jgi:polysaccharide deacetylase
MNRRHALRALGATAVAGFSPIDPALRALVKLDPQSAQTADQNTPSKDSAQQAMDEEQRKYFARVASRANSEAGVPVFLACQDLVAERVQQNSKPKTTTEFNEAIAHEFRAGAASWQRVRPDAPASDAGNVIEMLAERDFANGGKLPAADGAASTFLERSMSLADLFSKYPLIRAVNFHNTSHARAQDYERQIREYSKYFTSVNEAEMEDYLVTGQWKKPKPGLIVSVFEGYRNSIEVLLPIIEKYGFVAWFWMITGFLNAPIPGQLTFAENHDIDMLTHEYMDGRYALTWDDLRKIDGKHVIASHSRSHTQLSKLAPDVQRDEVLGSQEDFKKNLGHPVRAFVSLFGPAYGENAAIDRLTEEAGYDFILSNFRIQRIRDSRNSH